MRFAVRRARVIRGGARRRRLGFHSRMRVFVSPFAAHLGAGARRPRVVLAHGRLRATQRPDGDASVGPAANQAERLPQVGVVRGEARELPRRQLRALRIGRVALRDAHGDARLGGGALARQTPSARLDDGVHARVRVGRLGARGGGRRGFRGRVLPPELGRAARGARVRVVRPGRLAGSPARDARGELGARHRARSVRVDGGRRGVPRARRGVAILGRPARRPNGILARDSRGLK